MTQPVVSDVAQEMYDAISQWHPDDADYGWPGLLFCEAVCQSLQTTLDIVHDDADGNPGWSCLMDLNRCPDGDLAFLAQFRGVPVQAGQTPDVIRQNILTTPAAARGTPVALMAAVAATLTGSQHVTLVERDTSAYHATIQVLSAQMPNQAATLAAIANNKPAGLIIALQALSGPTYAQVQTHVGTNTYAARETTFPTYGDVQRYTP